MLSKPRKKARLEPPMVVPAEQAADVFPAVRYFQIHFEFLQEQIQLILSNQESLQQQLKQLESRLPRTANGLRLNAPGKSPLERLTTGHTVPDKDAPGLNLTGGR
ncbi:hypothetical protein QLH52_14365 [Methylomonas sp. OY6]|uniref:Transposase IS166 family protein n=1 Tax=Methylomonas defluvii TaxID=3045149 RepID=A0ABU4UIC4_9GAMM|nr:hypothetical protein [Methylomonas sp. OY6]MDX8128474.1 hypothetical protein [Methylomonas sp. OY6]